MTEWATKRVLIVVKTYPTPAWKGGEVVCTAGVTADGQWIRLFPIPFRRLDGPQQFQKYDWIEAEVRRAHSDHRPESFNVNMDSIRVVGDIKADKGWTARRQVLGPLIAPSMCYLRAERDAKQFPTLGLFRPANIERLIIEPTTAEWTDADLRRMTQMSLLDKPVQPLEKIPYVFYYEFRCDNGQCAGHRMSCTDWEMSQSYRAWLTRYGSKDWQQAFRQRYEQDMKDKNDTHFYVGTVHGHPNNWVIVGLWYPPKEAALQGSLL